MLEVLRRIRRRLRDRKLAASEWSKDAWSLAVRRMQAASRRSPKSRHRAAVPPRLLMIDELVPDPRYGAGYPRARKLLETIVAEGWDVTFYPMMASTEEVTRMRVALPRGVRFMSSNGRRALTRLIRTGVGAFDAVLVSRPATVEVFKSICAEVPGFLESTFRIYDAEALFAPREQRRRALFGYPSAPLEHEQALSSELELLQGADAITAVSPADATIFRARTSADVHVISHKIVVDPAANGFDDRQDLLFVGRLGGARDLSPNVDSLVWFVDEVMPLLDQRLGSNYRLQVVGLVASQAVEQLASERVVLNGLVDDVSALYARCRVFIAPTRFAAGIPLKVLEAFGMGIPCVVTPIVAEQIGVSTERTMLVGDDAASFADACFSLYTDATLWTSVRTQALKQLDRDYSSVAFDNSVRALLASVRPTLERRLGDRRIAPIG